MIEVDRAADGWRWRMISDRARVLVDLGGRYPDRLEAARAAQAWRRSFWKVGASIDGREASAI